MRPRATTGADAVVVGGGIVGCAVAWALASRGARVTLLERNGRLCLEASNAAAGMLAPLSEADEPGPLLDFSLQALAAYPRAVDDVQSVTGIDVEFRRTGILRVALSESEEEALRRRVAWQRDAGLELYELDAALLHELEPRLTPRARFGVLCPDEGQVSNQQMTLALARAAEARGARILTRSPVTGLRVAGGRVRAVRTPAGDVQGDRFVFAAGAWTGLISRLLRRVAPPRPIRGQMIALGGMVTPIRTIVWGPRGYLVPRANGLVFAGATVEDVGFRRRTTVAGLRRVRRMAEELVPQLRAAAEPFSWYGFRPGSPDGLPIIGVVPGLDNAIVATGHYRNGILLGPLTGLLVAELALTGQTPSALAAFAPARFTQAATSAAPS
ncbi:MAG TPA: glycine oxidase ThiO [Dehalococcoidia bacterium]|nr:glycine oxidase ThiO [Dehalococcoidia bacterium]